MGLKIDTADDVHFLGKYQISFEPTKTFVNHEFMYFYLTSFSNAFEKITMDGAEVRSVFEINIDEAVDLLIGEKEITQVSARDVNDKHMKLKFTYQSFKNFTDDSLYLRLFLALQDFCNGRNRKYIVI